jgi:hypothetical protein
MLIKPTTIRTAPTTQAMRNGKETAFMDLVPSDFFALPWYYLVTWYRY